MRLLITAQDDEGRSYLASADEVELAPPPGFDIPLVANLFRTEEVPPPPRRPSTAHHIDTRLPAGHLRWMVIDHAPFDPAEGENHTSVLHTSDAIDLVYIVSGSATFILDDGEHPIGEGDCIVMAGVPHGQRGGPDGCRMISVAVGTPPIE
jgi:mannose-6-phosphate isomerase-like protein (cupin superfamily)